MTSPALAQADPLEEKARPRLLVLLCCNTDDIKKESAYLFVVLFCSCLYGS